jgi:hypothetical protein
MGAKEPHFASVSTPCVMNCAPRCANRKKRERQNNQKKKKGEEYIEDSVNAIWNYHVNERPFIYTPLCVCISLTSSVSYITLSLAHGVVIAAFFGTHSDVKHGSSFVSSTYVHSCILASSFFATLSSVFFFFFLRDIRLLDDSGEDHWKPTKRNKQTQKQNNNNRETGESFH